MKPLELPPTLHTCSAEEVPNDMEILKGIAAREHAKLFEGYTLFINEANEYPYKFFARINIDNSRLWMFFKSLLVQLPDAIACIYHHRDDDPTLGSYEDKFSVLQILSNYEIEITQDGF